LDSLKQPTEGMNPLLLILRLHLIIL